MTRLWPRVDTGKGGTLGDETLHVPVLHCRRVVPLGLPPNRAFD